MVYSILRDSLYSKDSNTHWSSVLRQQKFLKELMEQLNAGGDSAESAINEAKQTFRNLTENIWLHLATDFERYKLSVEPWKKFARGKDTTPAKLVFSYVQLLYHLLKTQPSLEPSLEPTL